MIYGPRRKTAVLVAVFVVTLIALSGQGFSSSKWDNQVNASLIHDIAERNGELYMATNGGILVYSPATGQFRQYDNTSGIPSNQLTCLLFDDAGDLWLGTQDIGVTRVTVRSDGLTVHSTSPLGLAGLHFTSIDMWDGELVYGTTTGAGKFEQGLPNVTFTVAHGLPSNMVNDVLADDDLVWFATDGGTAVLDRLGFITPVGPTVAYAVEKGGGYIWVGSNNGVWRMSLADSSWAQIGPQSESVYSFDWDGAAMWAGGSDAFHKYDETGSVWDSYSISVFHGLYGMPSTDGKVTAIIRATGGDVYMGSTVGAFEFGVNLIRADGAELDADNLVFENPRPNGPGENRLIRLSYDVDGSVWVSCAGYGVSKLTPSGLWVNYNPSEMGAGATSSLFANLTCMADLDGHKWFSTLSWDRNNVIPLDDLDDGLDEVYANDTWTRIVPGDGGGDGYGTARPQRAVLDPAGNRWFLSDIAAPTYVNADPSWNGIHIMKRDRSLGDEWLQVKPDSLGTRLKGGDITHAVFDSDGTAYIAIKNYGVQSWYTGGPGYDWATLTNTTGDIWGGALNARLGVNDELGDAGSVTSLALRSDDVVWIGTTDGVFKYTPPFSFRKIGMKTGNEVGLLSQTVNFLVLDHQENLWVATDTGLNRISREDDNEIEAFTTAAAYQSLSERAIPYPLSIISPVAGTNCIELMMHPNRDLLYIATLNGLSILDVSPAAQQATDLSKVYVYPNPVDGRKGQAELKIDELDAPVNIEIYNLEGELVHSQTATRSEEVVWDLTTRTGFIVSSGVYFVRVDNGQEAVILSVTVVR
jgi:ligand-binding sensor domain-containing protein